MSDRLNAFIEPASIILDIGAPLPAAGPMGTRASKEQSASPAPSKSAAATSPGGNTSARVGGPNNKSSGILDSVAARVSRSDAKDDGAPRTKMLMSKVHGEREKRLPHGFLRRPEVIAAARQQIRQVEEAARPVDNDRHARMAKDLIKVATPAPSSPVWDKRWAEVDEKNVPEELHMANAERPYRQWRDGKGPPVNNLGVLIPDGYTMSTENAPIEGYPWLCPLRSCRKVFKGLYNLNNHFNTAHSRACLHDNEDGTLSLRGQLPKGYRPRVISKGPLDPADAAMAEPALPVQELYRMTGSTKPMGLLPEPKVSVSAASATPVPTSSFTKTGSVSLTPAFATTQPLDRATAATRGLEATGTTSTSGATSALGALGGDGIALWSYLQPFLDTYKNHPLPPHDGWAQSLISLPRVRDLEWNAQRQALFPFLEKRGQDVSAIIIQVTGEEAPEPCTCCQAGKGPFMGCIIIAKAAHVAPLSTIFSCGNCFYHRNQTYCSHKPWLQKRALALQKGWPVPAYSALKEYHRAPRTHPQYPFPTPSIRSIERGSSDASILTPEITRASEKRSASNPASATSEDGTEAVETEPPNKKKRLSAPVRLSDCVKAKDRAASSVQGSGFALLHDTMEMEDWEMAPGFLQETTGSEFEDLPESIAFSKPYLASNVSALIHPSVLFRVETIKSGQTLRLPPLPDKLRICSIAAGKMRVCVGEEPEFILGPHGMFKLRARKECAVTNRLYVDAILHITTVPEP